VPDRDDVQCDVTDTAALARAAGEFADPHGLGIWVNNAGRYPHTGPIETVSDDFLAEVFDLNVRAQFAACREAARLMPRGGSIINMASTTAFRGGKGTSAYATSKAAVVGMTRVMAAELGARRIRVNAVAPGVIDTPNARRQLASYMPPPFDFDRLGSANPLGVLGQPDHVARACLFFASDFSAFVTGTTLLVDGGAST
jgi:NAD(P)-dependent dehydrogenase (short-subunit alcohol dehydrogenase family)